MKRILLILAALIFPFLSSYGEFFSGGKGSLKEPYLISTTADLKEISQKMDSDYEAYADKHYKMTNDIDWSIETEDWKPIGNYDFPFKGSFEGDGYGVYHLSLGKIGDVVEFFAGFFGSIHKGVISNLNVNWASCSLSGDVDYLCFGGIVTHARDSSKISNCHNSGDIIISIESGRVCAGGIAGVATQNSLIENSSNTGNLSIQNNGSVSVGGICGGVSQTSIHYCRNSGNISSTLEKNSKFNGSIFYAGGIYGEGQASEEVRNSYNTGNISSRSSHKFGYTSCIAGGIAGASNGIIENNYTTGNIYASSGGSEIAIASGICGKSYYSIIRNNYNRGNILDSAYSASAAGICGAINGSQLIGNFALNNSVFSMTDETGATRRIFGYFSDREEPYIVKENYALSTMSVQIRKRNMSYPQNVSLIKGADTVDGADLGSSPKTEVLSKLNQYVLESPIKLASWTIDNKINDGYPIFYPSFIVRMAPSAHGRFYIKENQIELESGERLDSLSQISLHALADPGYKFTQWWDGNTDSIRSITLTKDMTISAVFTAKSFSLSFDTTGVGFAYDPISVTYHQAIGDLPQPTKEGSSFVAWMIGKDTLFSDALWQYPYDTIAKAHWKLKTYRLRISAQNGSVSGAGEYAYGSEVILTPLADPGYSFVKWSDKKTDNPRTVRIYQDTLFTALFYPQYVVSIRPPQNGTIVASLESKNIVNGDKVDSASILKLTATAAKNYKFQKWWDGNTDSDRTYELDSNISISAVFARKISIEDMTEEADFVLYPNPVKDYLNIECAQPVLRIEILDFMGRLQFSGKLNTQSIDVQDLASGQYVLRLYTATKIYSQKFIKK